MWDIILGLIPAIIGIAIGIAGLYWLWAKGKLKEVKEFVDAIYDAVQDDSVTNEELLKIIKEFKDIW